MYPNCKNDMQMFYLSPLMYHLVCDMYRKVLENTDHTHTIKLRTRIRLRAFEITQCYGEAERSIVI